MTESAYLTSADPPAETTHWTGRAMAKAVNLSLRTVQRIWGAHKLQPHRWRTFKRSKDPAFAEKVEDTVRPYMHPSATVQPNPGDPIMSTPNSGPASFDAVIVGAGV